MQHLPIPAVFLIGFCSACAPPVTFLGRTSPEAQSLVLLLDQGDVIEAWAVDLATPSPWLQRDLLVTEALELVALDYQVPLAALELAPGPLQAAPQGECGARALPLPAHVFSARITPESPEAQAWRPLETLPPVAANFRLPGPCPCRAPLVVAELELPGPSVRAPSRLDGQHVFLANGDGHTPYSYLQVGVDGVSPLPLADAPATPTSTLYFSPEDIWIASERGIAHGGLARPFSYGTDGLISGGVRAIGGPRPEDFYFVSTAERIYRITNGLQTVIKSSPSRESAQEGLLAHLGGDLYLAALTHTYQLWFLNGGLGATITVEPTTLGATAIARGGDDSFYVGTQAGPLLRSSEGELFPITGGDGAPIRVLSPFADGVLVGTAQGGLRQVSGPYGYCEGEPTRPDLRFVAAIELDQGTLFVGTASAAPARALLIR